MRKFFLLLLFSVPYVLAIDTRPPQFVSVTLISALFNLVLLMLYFVPIHAFLLWLFVKKLKMKLRFEKILRTVFISFWLGGILGFLLPRMISTMIQKSGGWGTLPFVIFFILMPVVLWLGLIYIFRGETKLRLLKLSLLVHALSYAFFFFIILLDRCNQVGLCSLK
ncbi:MAG: hypothetical protein V1743_05305 [Nanoarchaeota archaeon]